MGESTFSLARLAHHRRAWLAVALLFCVVVTRASGDTRGATCPAQYSKVGRLAKLPRAVWDSTVSPFVHAGAFPVFATADLMNIFGKEVRAHGWRGLTTAFRPALAHFMRTREVLYLLGYLGLLQVADGGFVSMNDFEKQTADFDASGPDDVIVVVNAFPREEGLARNFQLEHNRFLQRYCQPPRKITKQSEHSLECGGPPRAILLEPRSMDQMEAQLKSLGAGVVTRLEIRDHLDPGLMYFLDDKERFVSYLDDVGNGLRRSGFRLAKGGKIRLMGCRPANGEDGKKLVNQLAESLLPDGGSIYASQLTVYPGDGVSTFTGRPLPQVLSDRAWWGIKYGFPGARAAAPLYAEYQSPGLSEPKDWWVFREPVYKHVVPAKAKP